MGVNSVADRKYEHPLEAFLLNIQPNYIHIMVKINTICTVSYVLTIHVVIPLCNIILSNVNRLSFLVRREYFPKTQFKNTPGRLRAFM